MSIASKEIVRRPGTAGSLPEFVQPLLARIYAQRGVTDALDVDYALGNLLPPAQLGGLPEAAALLAEAIQADAVIVIVGDFDADGATSCALAVRALRAMGARQVSYLVPNRFEFGYGLTPEIVGVAATRQPDVIVTVDNGISSVDGVHAAQALGMSVLITDHHLPGEHLPTADVIVNPNLPGDAFASKSLAGVGVIFYVMLALRAHLRDTGWFKSAGLSEPNMADLLDLVAIGTVADCVPLDRNNRILVAQGLQRMRADGGRPGVRALIDIARRDPTSMVAADLGFAIGPRLNAAGRLQDMSLGIECLLSEDIGVAERLAQQLDEINRQRRDIESQMREQAERLVDRLQLDQAQTPVAFCLYDDTWHEGVVGLVASRIKEHTGRPVVALAPSEEGGWKGSARSVEGLHIRDVLARVDALAPGMMDKFGGHAMAAGLSLPGEHIGQFETLLLQAVGEFTEAWTWAEQILSDGALAGDELSLPTAEAIERGGPWGQGFPEPLFDGEFDIVDARVVGDTHLKMKLRDPEHAARHDAIMFRYLEQAEELPAGRVRLAYHLQVNEWNGTRTHQLLVRHLEAV